MDAKRMINLGVKAQAKDEFLEAKKDHDDNLDKLDKLKEADDAMSFGTSKIV